MNASKQLRNALALILSLAIVCMVAVEQVKARSLVPYGILPSGQVIDNDVFVNDQQVTVDGVINGDVFIIGNQVQVNGTINGSLFILGQNVVVEGEVSGTTYVLAVSLRLGSEAALQRNLYFVGVSLTTLPGSVIQRDLRTLCLGADIKGTIARDTRATIGLMRLIALIVNGLGFEFNMPQTGIQSSNLVALGSSGGLFAAPLAFLFQQPSPGGIDTAQLSAWLADRLKDFGLLLMLGALVYWLFRGPLNRTTQALRTRPLAALGYGFLALLIATNIFLVAMLVAGLIFVAGLWLGTLDLWSFALAFWALSFSALAFFLAAFWFVVVYGTKLIVAYLVSAWFFEKVAPKTDVPHFVALAVGVLIYILLRSIPMLGWVVDVVVTAWGLGACWLAYRK
jgi:cytoskeletal protein CcmA (bactofilin family)